VQIIRSSVIILLIVILCSCCLPAGAILQTFTYKGYTMAVQPETGNLTMLATHKWGCTYNENGTTDCGWIAITPKLLTGKVPTGDAFTGIKTGTTIEAVSIGNPGGKWTGLGLLIPVYEKGGWYATDLYGDLSSLPAPLEGSYQVTATTVPDCPNCSGSLCTAGSSRVVIAEYGHQVKMGTLLPGQRIDYENENYHSAVSVIFVNGQASAQLCPNASGGIGSSVQPVSVYVVHVNPSQISPIPTPQGSTGTLAVASIPSGAELIVDGQPIGLTPASRSGLQPGSHAIRVEKQGYVTWERMVNVLPGQYATWTASLVPLYGTLSIRSYPEYATVRLDGTEKGFTPLTLGGIPSGIHQLVVTKEGYQQENRTVTVAGGQITLLVIDLPRFVVPDDLDSAI
jgi:hypothetical protein